MSDCIQFVSYSSVCDFLCFCMFPLWLNVFVHIGQLCFFPLCRFLCSLRWAGLLKDFSYSSHFHGRSFEGTQGPSLPLYKRLSPKNRFKIFLLREALIHFIFNFSIHFKFIWDFKCDCILLLCVNVFSHIGQSCLIPVWRFLCSFRWPGLLKDFSHPSHFHGRSPVCILVCFFKSPLSRKLTVQWSHLWSYMSKCVFLCVSK